MLVHIGEGNKDYSIDYNRLPLVVHKELAIWVGRNRCRMVSRTGCWHSALVVQATPLSTCAKSSRTSFLVFCASCSLKSLICFWSLWISSFSVYRHCNCGQLEESLLSRQEGVVDGEAVLQYLSSFSTSVGMAI
ncbi:uncharacterized protein G2W53_015550 [Senna tora]|uniref:Uncharacterized protein n=1 Tax=Senna tora TaxID=362788 RepID=A0A834WVV8_9FABA|nr:uncharacterized protein G2W53_015550 [Senna tora]